MIGVSPRTPTFGTWEVPGWNISSWALCWAARCERNGIIGIGMGRGSWVICVLVSMATGRETSSNGTKINIQK